MQISVPRNSFILTSDKHVENTFYHGEKEASINVCNPLKILT